MATPDARVPDTRLAARLERMKADYLIEPTNLLERWKQRRAERWLVNFSVGRLASSLEDTRPQAAAARAKWRLWRAGQLGDQEATELDEKR
jgi:hypothetical protein